jgi:hypothetical protein
MKNKRKTSILIEHVGGFMVSPAGRWSNRLNEFLALRNSLGAGRMIPERERSMVVRPLKRQDNPTFVLKPD